MGTTAVTRIATRRDENALREQIVAFGKSLFDRGLTAGSSGNLSVRLDDGCLVTPTNASLGSLDPARLSKLDWHGNVLSGDGSATPSAITTLLAGPVLRGATVSQDTATG